MICLLYWVYLHIHVTWYYIKGVTQVMIHVTHMTCYYIYIPIQLHNLFAGRDAFDVVGTTSKNLQEIATSSLNTCLHWWDTLEEKFFTSTYGSVIFSEGWIALKNSVCFSRKKSQKISKKYLQHFLTGQRREWASLWFLWLS